MFDEPHSYLTGAMEPGAIERLIFLPGPTYARWVRDTVPVFLRDVVAERPEIRDEFVRRLDDHLSRVEERVSLAVLARLRDSQELLAPGLLEVHLIAEWGLEEGAYEVERYWPCILLLDTPAWIPELYEAGEIVPHEFTWDAVPWEDDR